MLRTEVINIPLSQTRIDTKNNRRVSLCLGRNVVYGITVMEDFAPHLSLKNCLCQSK